MPLVFLLVAAIFPLMALRRKCACTMNVCNALASGVRCGTVCDHVPVSGTEG
jgi:hypothetical protein